jgi:hypothetical protein
LNNWLSQLNGSFHLEDELPEGVNRGQIIEELEARRKRKTSLVEVGLNAMGRGLGSGNDWREYDNDQGYTHLEELLIYQPNDWRIQAREYLFKYQVDLERKSQNLFRTHDISLLVNECKVKFTFPMDTPTLAVLFHPDMARTKRYEPLNFLLAYDIQSPLAGLVTKADLIAPGAGLELMKELSPLDYFFTFQDAVSTYDLDELRKASKQANVPRLCLIKELDFCNIIGQRMAKDAVRQEVVSHFLIRVQKMKYVLRDVH